ncbi:hypothetical protein [Salinispora arenicola]|uniref:Uncharacterized protein n=1 Tax=Salinispora arenicola TaxID=168697 RepID=A0A542XKM5_SALAC|nr:hypothetical protein [Salinispora arenicola]MCN0152458.1 hypothetical protein [Salinispora arenicola]TQL36399.1 hypothetical protein FB564_1492 [Salinispora arenicola]GIM86023.1 hypothetical protein Sar04_27590 [Salinispora arenicola]
MTPHTDPRPEARVAAEWWANKLAGTGHHPLLQKRFTREQADRFAIALAMLINDRLSGEMWPDLALTIQVDYGLHPVLADAARRAGLLVGMYDLPMRTAMRINAGRVTVSEGYRAPEEVVWTA